MNELKPPTDALTPNAHEILRAWGGDGSLHVTIRRNAWSDPAAWGLVLADLFQHVARANDDGTHWSGPNAIQALHASYEASLLRSLPSDISRAVLGVDDGAGALCAPEAAQLSSRHLEILRVFHDGNTLTFVMRRHLWKDPATWGVFAADVTKSIAMTCTPSSGGEMEELVSRMKSIYDAEMEARRF